MKTKKFVYDDKERDVLVIEENDQDIFMDLIIYLLFLLLLL